MSENIKFDESGDVAILTLDSEVYTFETVGSQKFAQPGVLPFYTSTRSLIPVHIGEFDLVPHGEQNNLPEEYRVLLDENNLTPGILQKQASLLWGQGPALYELDFNAEGTRKRIWKEDAEIEAWLNGWDYEDYLMKASVEFQHMNGHFTKYYRNLGPRIGGPAKIAKLEHVSCLKSRLEWPDDKNIIRNIIVGDFIQPWKYGLNKFPIFNLQDPFANAVSARYSNMYSFAVVNDYSRSPFHGTVGWIRLASSIAKLLSNFNSNSAAIKYHIKVPAIYWENAATELQKKCTSNGTAYTDELLKKFKKGKFQDLADILRGVDNVGKFITTEDLFDAEANEYVGWKIEVLDQKVKDFIDAQLNIAKQAGAETTQGLGLHPALSNISSDGNLPSGSEQLYAFKLYLLTGVAIPESIVCKDINNAIAVNWPGKKLKIGFYHDAVVTEAQTAPKDRIKNNVPGGSK